MRNRGGGPHHNLAGARLPRWPRRSDPRDGDPANGEPVPRCLSCGMPDPIDLVGMRGGVAGRFPLCDRCWFHVNPPDPLDVTEAA